MMNKILTYLRKIELRLDDKVDKMDMDDEMDAVRKMIDETLGQSFARNNTASPMSMSHSQLSNADSNKLSNVIRKCDDLEKLMCGMQAELRNIDEAKVISNL